MCVIVQWIAKPAMSDHASMDTTQEARDRVARASERASLEVAALVAEVDVAPTQEERDIERLSRILAHDSLLVEALSVQHWGSACVITGKFRKERRASRTR